jgi:Zn-dependent peptidase ImmA (M78 family)
MSEEMAKSKSILPRGFVPEAEQLSESYRKELGLSIFAPLDAFKLAAHLDVPIRCVKDCLSEEDSLKLIGTKAFPKDFSAIRTKNCDGHDIIIHNSNNSPLRQQSDLMHELAHVIRKHDQSSEVKRLCYLLKLQSTNLVQEEEARYLGACLQMTKAGLFWAFKRNFTHEQISTYFSASLEMVNYRVRISGVAKILEYKARKRANFG